MLQRRRVLRATAEKPSGDGSSGSGGGEAPSPGEQERRTACRPVRLPSTPCTYLVHMDRCSVNADNAGLGLKAVWVGAEAFGNLVGATKGGKQQQQQKGSGGGSGGQALSRSQAIAAIREDYDQNYFVSGRKGGGWRACFAAWPSGAQPSSCPPPVTAPFPRLAHSSPHPGMPTAAAGVGSMSAYAPDCLFADPFAGFRGTDRFRRNVSNLGGLM